MYHLRRNVKFIIMKSVFDTDVFIREFYDLKGSYVGRQAKVRMNKKKWLDEDNTVITMSRRRGAEGTLTYPLTLTVHKRSSQPTESVKKDNDLRDGMSAAAPGKGGFPFADRSALRRMRATLKEDLEFFKRKSIIDYSMLVGVGDDVDGIGTQFSASGDLYFSEDDDETTRGEDSRSVRSDSNR